MPEDHDDEGHDHEGHDHEGHHHEHPEHHGEPRTLRHYVSDFFSNWSASDAPLATKVTLTLRNRARAYAPPFRGCCGHPGEPGC